MADNNLNGMEPRFDFWERWRHSPRWIAFGWFGHDQNYMPAWVRFHTRAHHPEILFGCWRLCINGVQFFVGRLAVTIHWPIGWHKE